MIAKNAPLAQAVCYALALGLGAAESQACTDARIVAQDGTVLTVRSMEFSSGAPLKSRLVVHPRGGQLSSPAPGGAQGRSWTAKYGYAYMDAFGVDVPVDGLNEVGLGFGALYLPDYAEYEIVSPANAAQAVSNLQFGAWILSQFSTVAEVKAAISTIQVWGEPFAPFGNALVTLHYVVHDAQGKSVVLEWVGGKLSVYDNTVGVMTNSPPYDWQMTNLRNYVNLSPDNAKAKSVNGVSYPATGQGSGLVGLPGDPTPPSRLIQTVVALNASTKPKDATEARVLGQKLLNRVDIPLGLARDNAGNSDMTQWAALRDHSNKVYYYRTYDNLTLRALDLKKLDFSAGLPSRRLDISAPQPGAYQIAPDSFAAF